MSLNEASRRRRRTRHDTHTGYGQTIHEMREMRALAMGQYGRQLVQDAMDDGFSSGSEDAPYRRHPVKKKAKRTIYRCNSYGAKVVQKSKALAHAVECLWNTIASPQWVRRSLVQSGDDVVSRFFS